MHLSDPAEGGVLAVPEAVAFVNAVRDYAIFMIDPTGQVLTWNDGARFNKGYAAREAIGRHFSLFYTPEDVAAGKPQRLLAEALEHGRVEDEGWRVRKDGSRFWADVVITPVRDERGTLLGFTKVTRDLTERRRHDEALRRAEAEVARERLRSELAEQMLREREDFIAVAAHELRTPLTALLLKLHGLQRMLADRMANDAKLAERFKGATRQADRLTGLVDRLLDVSRIVTGRLDLRYEDCDLVEILRRVAEDVGDACQQSGAELRLHLPERAVGRWDCDRLQQVLINLLTNAIKYGNGQPVDLTLVDDGPAVTVTVRDRGIGIGAEDLERIFGRFERAVSTKHFGGMGLGLYISRHIVAAHGGSLTAQSEPGKGATFLLRLPKAPPAHGGDRESGVSG